MSQGVAGDGKIQKVSEWQTDCIQLLLISRHSLQLIFSL